jgi:signal transduction histidine kinase/DNA-binding response OmpR family regulator
MVNGVSDPLNVPRILIVDDNAANLIALGAVLRPLGAEIVEANSGQEAIERVEAGGFAVALLDVQMPGMDGFETAAQLRATEHGRDLPILFVTAIARDDRYARKGYAAGAADYITKPYDADVLRARVKAFVDLFRQREELRHRDVQLRTRERDEALMRLAALERIVTAALEEGDTGAFLRKLLGVFLEAADSAESGTILLREGDELRVHASVGPASPPVGTIVSTFGTFRRELEATARQLPAEAARPDWPVRRQLSGFYRVPLLYDGDVIGAAQIASTKSSGFSEHEKRLFGAMAERAAWALAQRYRLDRFHSVLMSAPALVSILRDGDFEHEFANAAVQRLFGHRPILGKTAVELGATPELIASLQRVIATGETHSLEEHRMAVDWTGDGRIREKFFDVTLQPLRAPDGRIKSVLLFSSDVTAQVHARCELEAAGRERAALLESERAARAEAELANRAKDDFLATVSHELRTPLNAILGWTVIAQRTAPDELQRALSIIERNARAQTRIIEDVLDISRIIAGTLRLTFGVTDVSAVIEAAVEAARPVAEAKGVSLTSTTPVLGTIMADPERLTQIIGNLLSNAVKFTPAGGHVELTASSTDSRIVIQVADDGEGIDPSFLPHLFEPFRQGDGSTTRRHGGLGLGLAIVKQLTLAHGGTISAHSDGPKKGAILTIELPSRMPRVSHHRRLGDGDDDLAARGRLQGVRVLVVDDEKDCRDLVSQAFCELGASVTSVGSAGEGLERVKSLRPDVLISDIGMPEMDGFAFVRRVRLLPPAEGGTTPAIALTAYAHPDDSQRVFDAGFQVYVTKPVDPNSLVSAVAALVGVTEPAPSSRVRNGLAAWLRAGAGGANNR